MFGNNGFDKYFHAVVLRAGQEARQDGSATIEAQHLLLAIAELEGTAPQSLLIAAGLDAQTIRAALNREFERSLAVAGVTISNLPEASPYSAKEPVLGASSKLALERMARTYAKRELHPANLLLAILLAEVGTVPRALALAGVDRAELITRISDFRAEE
ncbi:hypothetical protein GCM10027088_61580 [Nocardia goodfellowii]